MTFAKSRLDLALGRASEADKSAFSIDPEGARRLEERFVGTFTRGSALDAVDVVAAGVAGAVGAAIDILLVAIPKDVTYLGTYPQSGSVITKWFKSWTVPSDNALAECAKVPFDHIAGSQSIRGMFPGNHRFMTPGHDPILGLVVGVHDILRGGRTAIDKGGVWRFDDGLAQPAANIAQALVSEVLHLMSDVATKAGLPAPLMTVAGLLRLGSFGQNERTLADLARYMYLEGYDLRHFVTTCSTPAAIRLVLTSYFLGRRFADEDYRHHTDASRRRSGSVLAHPRLQTIALLADGIACAANAGKIALFQGNPSAFNYGQWLALLRSGGQFMANQLESPTEVLLDRVYANELVLEQRWERLAQSFDAIDVPIPEQQTQKKGENR